MKNISVIEVGAILHQGILRYLIDHKNEYFVDCLDCDFYTLKMANNLVYMNYIQKIIHYKQIDTVVLDYNAGLTSIAEYKNKLKEKVDYFQLKYLYELITNKLR